MTVTLEGPEWRLANCISVGTEAFYEDGDPSDVRRRVCDRCPIKRECLDYALETAERWGVWGGKSSRQRLALIRAQKNDPNWQWPYFSDLEYLAPRCPSGHEVTGSNVFIDYRGSRMCRICADIAHERRGAA